MKIEEYKKLEKKINNQNFNEGYKTINYVMNGLSWFGHIASIFLGYFMISSILSAAMTDNYIAVLVSSLIILGGVELLKRDSFDKFSIQYLKVKSLSKVIPLTILSLLLISISFYATINGAGEFASKEKELEVNKELTIINFTDSLNNKTDSLLRSKDLEITSIKSKIETKDNEQTKIESLPNPTRQQKQRISDLKTEKSELKSDILKIESDKLDIISNKDKLIKSKEKELSSKTDDKKKDNSKNTVMFVIISTLIELTILAGVYFNQYYNYRSWIEFRDKLEKDPNYQKFLLYERILEVIYTEDTKMNHKLPSNKAIIDMCKVNDMIVLNKDMTDFLKIMNSLGIIKVSGSAKYFNKQRDLSFEILKKHFGVE
jgi:hypothetical protein